MKTLSRPVRQALAVTLLLVLLLAIWSLVVQPVLALASDRQADIASLSDQFTHLRAIAARRSALESRARTAAGQLAARNIFWSGPSQTAIAARVQDLVRNAAVPGGGQVVSFSESGTSAEAGFTRLSVRFRVEGTIQVLQRVLEAVQAARPALFVDNLVITPMDSAASTEHPPQLGMEVGIAGYLRAAS
jgi:general secretion pathway protein M